MPVGAHHEPSEEAHDEGDVDSAGVGLHIVQVGQRQLVRGRRHELPLPPGSPVGDQGGGRVARRTTPPSRRSRLARSTVQRATGRRSRRS